MNKIYPLVLLAASMSFAKLIGFLNAEAPSGWCGNPFSIFIDTENSNDQSGVRFGDLASSKAGVTFRNGGVEFKFCTGDRESLPQARFDYAVLSLDNECPAGSYRYGRHHDTQDGGHNSSTGYVGVNEVGRDVTLYFCYVPKNDYVAAKWPFHWSNGLFADFNGTRSFNYEFYIDDEDSNNKNKWLGKSSLPLYVQNGIDAIMNGSKNTMYRVTRWTSHMFYDLYKSAAETPASSESPLVAAVPFAPAVKGLNRSIVSVELKSAGDVKVSVVGVNGAVLANVTEKNLQPGDHQIKWNSGIVPSGRYIVKIEQNGMVNAKNVILK
ncbi:hypothetical protein [Fibrobacter succinogenes]|uniref:hypothetical protein n=1 Tax=Fibrobacter succinogenes TaxID=833 RepID=UPI0015681F38|nr:hypothetical protein [Fibrobacter succinogenes]